VVDVSVVQRDATGATDPVVDGFGAAAAFAGLAATGGLAFVIDA
jgi:hypothetical protein